jgi:hypothetical protein
MRVGILATYMHINMDTFHLSLPPKLSVELYFGSSALFALPIISSV